MAIWKAKASRAIRRGLSVLKALPPMRLSQWAAEHFYLSAESSYTEGRWQSYPYQIAILDAFGNDDIEEVDVKKSARTGYALSVDTPIPTLAGWKTMGDVQPGDQLFDEAGNQCSVRYVSPIYDDHECFEITFCDGTRVVADKGHRWLVESDVSFESLRGELGSGRTGRPNRSISLTYQGVVDTSDLYVMQHTSRGRNALAIRNTGALSLPEQKLPIPPYTLGLWLGDGYRVSPRILQHRSYVETADYIRAEGINVDVRYVDDRHPNNATYFLDASDTGRPVSRWASVFRRLGLLDAKHIPDQYLRASAVQRMELLRGLMDSDGTIGKDGRCNFTNTNEKIARGVYELLASLGYKAGWTVRRPKKAHHLVQYHIGFKATHDRNPFHVQHHRNRVLADAKPGITNRRRVVSVTPVQSVPVRCIEVDSKSCLFLCTRAMIPTHNTKMLMAAVAYFAVFRRRNQAIWQPTDSDAQEFVETELNPMLRDVAPIKPIFPALEKKHQHNTNSYKKFLGCVAYIKGGSSARNYRRISVDVTILDEVDGFDKDIDQEGSPRKLAKKRTEGATFPKQIVGSTPKLKYLSEIGAAIEEADAVYRFNVPCPHCDAPQALEFGGKTSRHGLKWFNNDPETAAYACVSCAALFTQADYLRVWARGRWMDISGNGHWYCQETGQFKDATGMTIRPPKHIGFDNLWAIYSPQTTWVKIVKEYLAAVAKARHGERSDLKTFVNTTMGQEYEDNAEKTEAQDLIKRAEDFPLQIVQRGGLILLAAIDVQKDRFEMLVWALGRGEEMWTVDYQIIEANPAIQSEWEKLDAFLLHGYPHAAGGYLGIEHAAIDTGGHWTHQAYNYVRQRKNSTGWTQVKQYQPKIYATKGASTANLPISGRSSLQDVNRLDKVIKRGVKLYTIGTDTAKDLFHGRLQVIQHGPGFVHMSKYLPDAFFEHITNEVRVLKQTPKGTVSSWVLKRAGVRNEALDCTVMTLFCAHKIALHRKTNAEWWAMESIVQPNQHDLFALPDARPTQPLPHEAVSKRAQVRPASPPQPTNKLASDHWNSRL